MFGRLKELVARENSKSPDTTLPDPREMPYTADEWEMLYQIWAIWAATDKKFLPSQLIAEMQSGYGRILTGILDIEAMYGKVRKQWDLDHAEQKP